MAVRDIVDGHYLAVPEGSGRRWPRRSCCISVRAERRLAIPRPPTRPEACGDQVRLRLLRRQQGHEGPPRRQGRQPRRDDQHGPPRPARLHDHHRGLPRPPARRAAPRRRCSRRPASIWAGSRRRWARRSATPTTRCSCRVRSGAKFSMPGMMDTVLNLGLNDGSVEGLAKQTGGDMRFARRRLPPVHPDVRQDRDGRARRRVRARARRGEGREGRRRPGHRPRRRRPRGADRRGSRRSTRTTPARTSRRTRRTSSAWRSTPCSESWNGKRAIDYRRQNKISDDLGTAVNVQAMVFGNRGEDSGTGVAFTRDPSTGEKVPYGDYLVERAGRGRRGRHPQHAAARQARASSTRPPTRSSATSWTRSRATTATCATSSSRSRSGKLWILQTRIGKRTGVRRMGDGRTTCSRRA